MEKLLHERLREHNKATIRYFTCGDEWQIELDMNEAQALADEIERYYIPRPRFDDGEPVQWSEQGLCWQDTDDYDPQVPWYFTAIDRNGIPIATTGDEIVSRAEMTDDGFVKRPTPKVYDADGVEINVGDTVYRTSDGSKYHVEKVYFSDDCGGCFVGHGECCGSVARYFTHERPVFDAEGVRCKNGETVYLLDKVRGIVDEPCVIDHVTSDGTLWWEGGGCAPAYMYTHREPDSPDRIKADRELTICEYNAKYQDAVRIGMNDHLLNRAIALIERGA